MHATLRVTAMAMYAAITLASFLMVGWLAAQPL